MSTSWSAPDPRRAPLPPPVPPVDPADPFATLTLPPYGTPPESDEPALVWREEARTGGLTAVVTVLAGAPVGLLWAALAPREDVVVDGPDVSLTTPSPGAFIAGDGYFLGAVLLAGLATGLAVWWLARRAGPGVVTGLAVGSTLAAVVAMQVGQEVGAEQVQAAVDAGREVAVTLNLRLRATEALVGWPVAALVTWVSATLARGR